MNRAELCKTLSLVGRALADSDLVPIYQCFAFSGETALAYNDSLGIIAPLQGESSFAVNGKTLLGWLQNIYADEVTFTFEGKEVIVKAGRSTFKMPWFPKEDFLFVEPESEVLLSVDIDEELIRGIDTCTYTSVSNNEANRGFMGVCLTTYKGKLALYSTDGDAITRFLLPRSTNTDFRHVLPNGFCDTLTQICGSEITGKLEILDGWARAVLSTGYVIYGRLLAMDNPIDYEDWIKKTMKRGPVFRPLPRGMDEALSRARVVADAESSKTDLTIRDGKIKFLTTTSMGVVRDVLPFTQEHPDVEAKISSELMQHCASGASEMAVFDNVTVFRTGDDLLVLISNMGS